MSDILFNHHERHFAPEQQDAIHERIEMLDIAARLVELALGLEGDDGQVS